MTEFLYYFPLSWVFYRVLLTIFSFVIHGNKKDKWGVKISSILFFQYAIPMIIVISTFYVCIDDFSKMYVSWTIFGLSCLIRIPARMTVVNQQKKAIDVFVANMPDDMKKPGGFTEMVKKMEQEQKNNKK